MAAAPPDRVITRVNQAIPTGHAPKAMAKHIALTATGSSAPETRTTVEVRPCQAAG